MELEKVLDEHFPKGTSKARGPALMLFAQANILHDRLRENAKAEGAKEFKDKLDAELPDLIRGDFEKVLAECRENVRREAIEIVEDMRETGDSAKRNLLDADELLSRLKNK